METALHSLRVVHRCKYGALTAPAMWHGMAHIYTNNNKKTPSENEWILWILTLRLWWHDVVQNNIHPLHAKIAHQQQQQEPTTATTKTDGKKKDKQKQYE